MSADHHRALLVAETKAAGFDADAQERFSRISGRRFDVCSIEPSPSARLLMSGPGVFTVEIKQTIEAGSLVALDSGVHTGVPLSLCELSVGDARAAEFDSTLDRHCGRHAGRQ